MSSVGELMKYLHPDRERLERGRRRQAATCLGREPDTAPLLLPGGPVPGVPADLLPHYNMHERYHSKEKMLHTHVAQLVTQANTRGDGMLAVRADLGTALLATVFGLEQRVFTDKMPWLKEHCSKAQIEALTASDLGNVAERGLMPMALEYTRYFREQLEGKAAVFVADTQSPFDLAHLVYGDALFYDIYDDPAFVHHLLRLCTLAYVEGTKAMKAAAGESPDSGCHNQQYMAGGGVRACEDTTTLLSPEQVAEFSHPYLNEALGAFGGGWVHFCGSGHHFLDALIALPNVRGINFGNPERYDFSAVMAKLRAAGKYYVGVIPPQAGESQQVHMARVHGLLADGEGHLVWQTGPEGGQSEADFLTAWANVHGAALR